MLQFEELKLELEGLKPEIDDLADALGLKSIMSEIEQLEHRAAEPGFWDDMEKSQKILEEKTKDAADAARLIINGKIAEAMNKYN